MEQAPEQEVLKRKRSRPSDWWANGSIVSSTPQRLPVQLSTQQDESEPGPAKKRGRLSDSNAPTSLVRGAPAAGNRGRPTKKKQQTEGEANDENRGPDELAGEKPLRRGRSSGNAEELRRTADPVRDEHDAQTSKNKRRRKPAQRAENEVFGDNFGPQRRGRSAAVQAEQYGTADVVESARGETVPRRRGRPSIRVSDVQAAVQEEGDVAEPQKRGRRPVVDKMVQASDEHQPEIQDKPTKRGRRPVEITSVEIEEPIGPVAAGKRVRRSDAVAFSQEPRPSTFEEPVRGRPRTRRSDADLQVPQVTPHVSTQEERGRRRTRLSDVKSQQDLASESMKPRKGKPRKRSRQPQATNVNLESASSKLTKAPSGSQQVSRTKASKSANVQDSGQIEPRAQQSSSSANRRVSSGPSKKTPQQKSKTEPSRKRKEVEKPETTLGKRRRLSKAIRQEVTHEPEPEEPSMLYQHLQPVARKVSRQTIAAKWDPLPPSCADRISRLLQDVQRPVIAQLSDERKKVHASTALQMVSRRLVSKISKGLPFPPSTRNNREDDLDFEKILDHNRALEAQLTPALHGNELLEAELARETARLEADNDTLAALEKNAKDEATMRNQAARKLHFLLQSDESQVSKTAFRDEIGMEDNGHHALPLGLSMDTDLQGLIKGLHDHVDTINGNMKQVDGISEAIVRSKAAIQGTLFDHLSEAQYGEVILGTE